MLTILSIIPYKVFPATVGGQKNIALFNEYLAKECKLICATVKSNDPQYAKGYKVLNFLPDKPYRYINIFSFLKFKKLIHETHATHLLLEHPYFGWLGILLKWSTGIKLVIHSHNIEGTRWKSLGKWWWKILWEYERITHRAADFNFFIQDEDRKYAIKNFKLDPATCTTVTYGIDWDQSPTESEKNRCRQILRQLHNIAAEEIIYLFNGALDYKPNLDALSTILEEINPLLLKTDLRYKILICGRGLPDKYNELKSYSDKNIIYAGFVEDIAIYFKGADIFLNPLIDGGGIKTKLVEALGYNTKTISTVYGSVGVNPDETNGLLAIVPDNDWTGFKEKMIEASKQPQRTIPPLFYEKFSWRNIARKAIRFIQQKTIIINSATESVGP